MLLKNAGSAWRPALGVIVERRAKKSKRLPRTHGVTRNSVWTDALQSGAVTVEEYAAGTGCPYGTKADHILTTIRTIDMT